MKAIYGLAASFDRPTIDMDGQGVNYSIIEPSTVKYFKNVALSLGHVPKETITTTANSENGELILVQKGWQLFFKFIPTTKDGERIYRYVKQRKYRQCSYSWIVFNHTPDENMQRKTTWFLDEDSSVLRNHVGIYEVCLTNNPADDKTFCTTDGNHPMFVGIDWKTNVEFLHSHADPWGNQMLISDIQQRFDAFDENVARLLKGFEVN